MPTTTEVQIPAVAPRVAFDTVAPVMVPPKPLTLAQMQHGVDAIRNVVFSGTVILSSGVEQSLAATARAAGLIRWTLPYDVAIMTVAAAVLTLAGAWSFSKSQAG